MRLWRRTRQARSLAERRDLRCPAELAFIGETPIIYYGPNVTFQQRQLMERWLAALTKRATS